MVYQNCDVRVFWAIFKGRIELRGDSALATLLYHLNVRDSCHSRSDGHKNLDNSQPLTNYIPRTSFCRWLPTVPAPGIPLQVRDNGRGHNLYNVTWLYLIFQISLKVIGQKTSNTAERVDTATTGDKHSISSRGSEL